MNDADRFKLLFGPYKAPRFRVGHVLHCEVRGEVKAVWPPKGVGPVGAGRASGGRGHLSGNRNNRE
jgi:hypothetical protein